MTQSTAILAHLKRGRTLTPLSALRLFGCFRLGARIWSLKQAGHPITSTLIRLPSGKRVAAYVYG